MSLTNTPAQPVLTDDDLLRICQQFNPGQDLDLAKAVRDAVLSKLRAPVADERGGAGQLSADERAANTPIKTAYVEHFGHAAGWLGYKGSWFTEGFHAGRRAALASAPVAGEAQTVAWKCYDAGLKRNVLTDNPKVADMLRAEGGNTVRPLVYGDAAPQASAETQPDADAVDVARAGMELHSPGMPEHTVCAELVRLADALKQPQAAKDTRPCSCPSGDGSLRHPCAAHPTSATQPEQGERDAD